MKIKWLYILLLALLASCRGDIELEKVTLIERSPMPEPLVSGCSFAYQHSVYVFGGRDENSRYSTALWRYDIRDDQWRVDSWIPCKARVSASACVTGMHAYMGLGYSGPIHRDSTYLRDFWRYNLHTKEWTRLADFPANTTVQNQLFATDSAIYAMYGFYRQFTQDVYRYDIAKNEWEKVEFSVDGAVPRAMDVAGASCQGRHFVGTGFNRGSQRFWAEWVPEKKMLVARKAIKGSGRNAAACCATDEYVYLAGGRHYGDTLTNGFFYSSIQRYSPQADEWEYVGNMPQEMENMYMECVKGEIYLGIGEDKDGKIQNKWYRLLE